MTIAVAYAIRDPGASGYWLAADSRLTLESGVTDTFVKTIDLTDGIAIAIAGSTLAQTAAAEIARPMLASHMRASAEKVSFYDTCRVFSYFARKIYRETGSTADADAVLCGFYRDGVPGLAHVQIKAGVAAFYKPSKGGRCGVAIGTPSARALVRFAIERASGLDGGFDSFMSTIYTVIKHEGSAYETVGGGIAFGFCERANQPVQWPTVEIDGEVFYRGIRIQPFALPGWQAPVALRFRQGFADAIEHEAAMSETEGLEPWLKEPPRAVWPVDGARESDLFRFSLDPAALQMD